MRSVLGLSMSRPEISRAAKLVVQGRVVALTGAGVSAESGIPTFRGPGGLWERFRPEDLATPEAFARDPRRVWAWYKWRLGIVLSARPNPAHLALAELERMGLLEAVITQNVDGLHQEAGSKRVVELHGSLRRARCTRCGLRISLEAVPSEDLPKCPSCGGLLRPDVVWFGEPLPSDAWEEAVRLAATCRCMLVVGTSGTVYPAASLPFLAKERGAAVVEVNVNQTPITEIAVVSLRGRASEVLPLLVSEVKRLLGGVNGES